MKIKELADKYAKSANISTEYGYTDQGAVDRKRLANAVIALLSDNERLADFVAKIAKGNPTSFKDGMSAEAKAAIEQHQRVVESL